MVNQNSEKIAIRHTDILQSRKKQEKLGQNRAALESEISELQEQVQDVYRQYMNVHASLIRARNAVDHYQNQLNQAESDFEQVKITDEDRAELSRLTGSIQGLQEERDHIRMKRDALTRNSAAEADYENVCALLRTCQERIAEDSQHLEESRNRLAKEGERFVGQLDAITYRINERFQSFMSQMNPDYQGRIVRTGDETFGSYGLNLEVRFREGDPFRPLLSGYQSGGEKSCAAMVFILSLQGISTAPFRLVDEINQGLDSHNETKMMRLVGKIANGCHGDEPSSQYIILTPQLVEGGMQLGFHVLWMASRPRAEDDTDDDAFAIKQSH